MKKSTMTQLPTPAEGAATTMEGTSRRQATLEAGAI